jgi:archaellum component FlaC
LREALLGKLLLLLSRATPEELVAIYRFAMGQSWPESQPGVARTVPEPVLVDGSSQAGTQGGPAYVFRGVGRHWEVVFAGGRPFRLRNTLGTRYLDYLLHEPNEPIRAFDLEVEVQPEKGEARVRDSFQPESDAQAMREYREELGRLQGEREKARAAGHREEVERLVGQIEALESVLNESGSAANTGERARNNVRKAIGVVTEQLRDGSPEEKALAEHLQSHLSIGHECLYSQPRGRIWD